jgi:tripartite motif-containing protein 2/3
LKDAEYMCFGLGGGSAPPPLYVANDTEGCVSVIQGGWDGKPPSIRTIGTKGTGRGQLQRAAGVAVDGAGRVFITDFERHCVVVFHSSDGRFLFEFGARGKGAGEFERPDGIAVPEDGRQIFVADKDNHRICMFDGEGRFMRQFGSLGSGDGHLKLPARLGLDEGRGHVYVSDHRNHRVCVFDVASGRFVRSFGQKGQRRRPTQFAS